MGLLAGIAGTAVSGVLGGLIGRNAANQEFKHQKALMALQQKYARENAETANQYARQNAMDAAILEKAGKQQAGINTAFGQNGSVASVGQGAMAGSPTAPGPIGIGSSTAALTGAISNSIPIISQALLQNEQAKKVASERQQVDIDNITRASENVARVQKYGSETAKNNAETTLTELQTQFKRDTYDSDVNIANANATIQQANADTQYNIRVAQIDDLIASAYKDIASGKLSYQEIQNKKEEIKNLRKERDKMQSEIDYNKARTENTQEQTEGYKLNNEYLNKTMQDRINQQSYETLIKKVESLPKSYRDVVMRSYQWQVMVYKLEHNQQLSEQEIKNLDELLRLDYYDPNKNAALWINFVSKMK